MLTNAVLLLLYVTAMPSAPILVDRISVPAGQDIQAMEKHAKVGLKMSLCQHRGLGKSFNLTSCGNNEKTFQATFHFIRQWRLLRTAINNSRRIFVFAAK